MSILLRLGFFAGIIVSFAAEAIGNPGPIEVRVNQRVTLIGTLRSGTYHDCCSDGKVRNLPFYAVHLSRPILFVGPSQGWGPLRDVQLGGFQKSSRGSQLIGRQVTVQCERIWDSITGHYAEHAWCDDAEIVP